MVNVQQIPLRIADGNVNPENLYNGFFVGRYSIGAFVHHNAGLKESPPNFQCPVKLIPLFSDRHHIADHLHHIPDWLVALATGLTLNFKSGKSLLGGCHKVNRSEPVHKRQVGGFHDRSTWQGCTGPARFELKFANGFNPVVDCSFAFPANTPFLQPVILGNIPAGLLVWKLIGKTYKLLNHYFNAQQKALNLTYLRYCT